jgi:RimJ/RimL family protein N-acetyltransferase
MTHEIIIQNRRISARATTEDDLGLILQIERDPENAGFIAQWSRAQHLETITDPDKAHWIIQARADRRVLGYLILLNLGTPDRCVLMKRIVIAEKGKGYGREALQMVKQAAFERFGAHRLWFDVMTHNQRARRVYQAEGFVEEGTMRECMQVEGRFVSLVIMSMLEDEYRKSIIPQSTNTPQSGSNQNHALEDSA